MLTRSAGLALGAVLAMSLPAMGQHQVKTKTGFIVPEHDHLPGHEKDTYRYGQIMGAVRGISPRDCEIVCSQNNMCATWTFLPATFEGGPICELKATIGQQSYRPGAYSGIALRFQPGAPKLPAPVPMTTMAPKKPTSRVIRTIKAPPPPQTEELRGGPKSAAVRAPAAPARPAAPAPVKTVSAAPQPLAPKQPEALKPAPLPQTVLAPKSPPGPAATRKVPQFQMVPAPAAPAPAPTAKPTPAPAPLQPQTVSSEQVTVGTPQTQPVPGARKPWTERTSSDTGYSVGGLDYVPGDEEATAGFGSEFSSSN